MAPKHFALVSLSDCLQSYPNAARRCNLLVNDQGQALIEFALCLPVLLLVVTGLLAFGLTINNYLLLTDATNVAARQLAISRGQTTDPCSTAANTVYSAAPLLAPAKYTFTTVLNGISYSGNSCSSSSTTTGAAGNLLQGTTAKLTVSYPCTLGIYGMNFGACVLQAQTSELVQ